MCVGNFQVFSRGRLTSRRLTLPIISFRKCGVACCALCSLAARPEQPNFELIREFSQGATCPTCFHYLSSPSPVEPIMMLCPPEVVSVMPPLSAAVALYAS